MKYFFIILLSALLYSCATAQLPSAQTDLVAENMLIYQLDNGGWAQDHGDAMDYKHPPSETVLTELPEIKASRGTIDDGSTTREISYLLTAYDRTKNAAYLVGAEKGIQFLLEAQGESGGWPQEYPNPKHYHANITFNDNAMIDVMELMRAVADGNGAFAAVNKSIREEAQTAVDKGIDCILNTQYVDANGRLTSWGAQHDPVSLLPASARKFEPASLSGSESVEIVRFLMDIEQPSEAVRRSVRAAVAWFDEVRIDGYRIETITAPDQPNGKDRILVEDPDYTSWARFYELDTFRPIFAGRDGIVRYNFKEIDHGRRTGYSYYGKWAKDLLKKEFPRWEDNLGE